MSLKVWLSEMFVTAQVLVGILRDMSGTLRIISDTLTRIADRQVRP